MLRASIAEAYGTDGGESFRDREGPTEDCDVENEILVEPFRSYVTMRFDDSVVSHFSSSAERYVGRVPARQDFFMRAFEPYADRRLRVLDVGCGTAQRLEGLAQYYPRFDLHGVDITPAMLKSASSLRPESIEFVLGNCLCTPYPDSSFHAVILSDVLHHLVTGRIEESRELREAGLREITRLIGTDGFVLLKEVCLDGQWRTNLVFRISQAFAQSHVAIPFMNIHRDVVVNFFALDELRDTLARLRLTIVGQEMQTVRRLRYRIPSLLSCHYHVWYVLKRSG